MTDTTQAAGLDDLLTTFERQANRFGELWERCQGKGWPEKESREFHKIRDEQIPALKAKIRAALAAQAGEAKAPVPAPRRLTEADRVPDEYRNQARGYRAGWNDALSPAPAEAKEEPTGENVGETDAREDYEELLSELVDKILPGQDSGNLLADAMLASKHLDKHPPTKPAAPGPEGGVDCIGLALDLEARAKLVESQTTERAMLAAANGLRLLATSQPQAAQPVGYVDPQEIAENFSSCMSPAAHIRKDALGRFTQPLYTAAPALTEKQERAILFLLGVGLLRGVGFGSMPDGERAPFWWRKELSAAFPALRSTQGGEQA